MDVGRENPNRPSHPLSKNFRDRGESRAIVDGNEENETLFHQSRLLGEGPPHSWATLTGTEGNRRHSLVSISRDLSFSR